MESDGGAEYPRGFGCGMTKTQFEKVNINDWIYTAGLPANAPIISVSRFIAVDNQIKLFANENKINTDLD